MPRLRVDPAMLFFILFAILLGGYVRIAEVALYFPINDGGMFYRMTIDLVANGFRLPAVTTYNAANIPYAYPPLAFYLAGFLASVFHWPLLDIFRLLPALIATLTIPAFALLADDLLKSRAQVALAILIFALMPATFGWLIMGGGISRSLGFLFSILTLWAAYRLFTHPGRVYIAATALFGAFAILGHPELTIHTAAGRVAVLFPLWQEQARTGQRHHCGGCCHSPDGALVGHRGFRSRPGAHPGSRPDGWLQYRQPGQVPAAQHHR